MDRDVRQTLGKGDSGQHRPPAKALRARLRAWCMGHGAVESGMARR